MSEFYVVVLEANSEGKIFATIPDLPGVNTTGATQAEALAYAIEFANDYVRDLVDDGHPVPPARGIEDIEYVEDEPELGRALIPVEVPGKSVKISISMDEALLARADNAATAEGLTRSGYIAAAITGRLSARASSPERAGRGFREAQAPFGASGGGPVLMVPVSNDQAAKFLSSRPAARGKKAPK